MTERQVMATKGSTENAGAWHKPTGQVWQEIKVCCVSVHTSLGQGLSKDQVEECNITLYTKESPTAAEIFLTECFSSAIIDTACTRTVCGQQWLDSYITELTEIELN